MARRRSSALSPDYTWDDRTGRYRNRSTGRFVPDKAVREAIDGVIANSQKEIRNLSNQLREGKISIATWQTRTADEIKMLHLGQAAASRGGWAQMTQADFGRVGQRVRFQYEKLRAFAGQIEAGTQRLDGTLLRRADMYAQAGRTTYHAFGRLEAAERGYTEERNVLNPAEHCAGCLTEDARGWVPIGQLVPIGMRDCMTNDRCSIQYRNAGGETRLVA